MSVKRVNLLADLTFHAPDGAVRIFGAGVRNLPLAAAKAAEDAGKLGPLPKAAQAPKPAAKAPAARKPSKPAKKA